MTKESSYKWPSEPLCICLYLGLNPHPLCSQASVLPTGPKWQLLADLVEKLEPSRKHTAFVPGERNYCMDAAILPDRINRGEVGRTLVTMGQGYKSGMIKRLMLHMCNLIAIVVLILEKLEQKYRMDIKFGCFLLLFIPGKLEVYLRNNTRIAWGYAGGCTMNSDISNTKAKPELARGMSVI